MSEENLTIYQKIANMDKKFAWSFTGVILAVVFGLFGIYSVFFYKPKPNLIIEKTTESDVIKLSEEISSIEIIYDSTNIRESNQNLKLIEFKLINLGNKSVTENSYATTHPLSILVKNGLFVETPIITNSSSDYLSNFELSFDSTNQSIKLPNAIIEKNEYYIIKLLILHELDINPEFKIIGKIEGQNSVDITNVDNLEKKLDLSLYFILKIFGYALLLIALIMTIGKLYTKHIVSKRKNQIANYLMRNKLSLNPQLENIFGIYTDNLQEFVDISLWTINDLEEAISDLKLDKLDEIVFFLKEKYKEGLTNSETLKNIRLVCYLIRNEHISLDNFSREKINEDIEVLEGFVKHVKKSKKGKSAPNKA